MNEKYYYLRNTKNEPVATICLLGIATKLSRGVAICSHQDMPRKRIGRAIARGRAQKALWERGSSNPIRRSTARVILDKMGVGSLQIYYKSDYQPHLSVFETNLWKDKR